MKFHVGLVHNFDGRFAGAVALHQAIIAKLRFSGFTVSHSMRGEQPPAVDPGRLRGFKQKLLDISLKKKYEAKTLGSGRVPTIRKQIATTVLAANKQERLRMCIDGQVLRKHAEIWNDSINHDADWLVVLEDDALPNPGWEVRLDKLVEDLIRFNPQYADLAGGFKTESVTSQRLFVRMTSSGILFSKVMTNTTGGYAMGRDFVEKALGHFDSLPERELLAIDTFVNDVTTITKTAANDFSLHTSPTIFTHGSRAGDLDSWR